jgi:GDP-L-fucose synthase
MEKNSKIYVAGHKGMVGSAIVRKLTAEGFANLVTRTSDELDLRSQSKVDDFFEQNRPEYVFFAAAKVGGIIANNKYRADFIYDNLVIESNIIYSAYKYYVTKLMFLGSSCIYPKLAPQPLREEYLLTGPLEITNEPYAIAKIAGIKLCEAFRAQYNCDFISVMPTNLYGIGDNYHVENSHVLPALLRKFHEAKINGEASVTVWGSGTPRREFLFADDLADACFFLMQTYTESHFLNIGTGEDITIAELALLIKKVTNYQGSIIYDSAKPDGTPRKMLDVSNITYAGWKYKTKLSDGIKIAYKDYLEKMEKCSIRIS